VSISFSGNSVVVDGRVISMPWPVKDVTELGDKIFVLFNLDSCLSDPAYKMMLRRGGEAIKNFVAFDKDGNKLWEADFPEASDYYYRIVSTSPLIANSFSSFMCEIDPDTGVIKSKEFLK
jgi:hypothetical protein